VTEKRRKKLDSLLAHCLLRAMLAEQGWKGSEEELVETPWKATTWRAAKATPKASRVAAFVVMWALAMRDEGRAEYTITEYQRYWNEGERKVYRLQQEFRELWPELETPHALAVQVVKYLDSHTKEASPGRLPLAVPVRA
jgi:hypothetical protein